MAESPSSTEVTYPPPPEDDEAGWYFNGLPSRPRLVGRTASIPWEPHRGTFRYSQSKQLGPVVDHKLNTAWEYDVAPKILACLDELGALWTSADIVRIEITDIPHAPVVLWIGVKPGSLAGKDAVIAAYRCLDILKISGITDVDVELRESLVTRSAGPALLPASRFLDPTTSVRHPLTHTLSLHITSSAMPQVAGTGGLFLSTGPSPSSPLFLLTARHAVLPPDATIDDEEGPTVFCPGDVAFENCIADARSEIMRHTRAARDEECSIALLDASPDAAAEQSARARHVHRVEMAGSAVKELLAFCADVDPRWADPAARLLGHVVYAPPAHVNADGYMEDYALVAVDPDKIDRATFTGNGIDLRELSVHDFLRKMFPGDTSLGIANYPRHRLLALTRVLSHDELRKPTPVDEHEAPHMVVLKDGAATGLTIGRASGIMSFVREYADDGTYRTSKVWAILPYDQEAGVFSAQGDSGAVVVDGIGRIGGMIVGGTGKTAKNLDITYATPFTVIEKSIKAKYPGASLYSQAE